VKAIIVDVAGLQEEIVSTPGPGGGVSVRDQILNVG
jgi:hypothetical protein